MSNNNNNNNNNKNISENFQLSFKKIALYNFIIMGVSLLITGIIVFVKYSTADLKKDHKIIISIMVCSLFMSNMFILIGVAIANYLKLSPFVKLLVALLMFVTGYVVGYYLGKTIGNLITKNKEHKVDKDTAALQAAIAAAKRKPQKMAYNKDEMEAKEYLEKTESSIMGKIKSLLGDKKKKKIKVNEYPFKYSYGISFWFFIEAQPPNVGGAYAKFVNILNYGGKPSIKYKGDNNELKVSFKMKDENSREILLYDKLKYQKWNHFIVNYDHGTVDVFINNELVASEPGIAPYMVHDEVVVGEKNGINGGIKDVKYFPEPIDLKTINYLFRMY